MTTTMPTFFDLLPNDIHDKIAHFLFSSTRYPEKHYCESCLIDSVADDNLLDTLLDYAKSSPAQCRSVLGALSERLFVTTDWRSQRVADWISVSAKYVKTIELPDAVEFSLPSGPPPLPKLERAVIVTRPDQLSLIHGSPKLRDLTVYIINTSSWGSFVSTVGSLKLEVLQLVFIGDDKLRSLSRFQLMSLRAACPAVEVLYFEGVTRMTEAAWDMIKGMGSLKKLRVKAPIADEHISFVQTLPDIGLLDVVRIQHATQFGAAVTSLGFLSAHQEDISRLDSLPNLRKLCIRPVYGHERSLVGKIDNVEELRLSWGHHGCDHSYEAPEGAMTGWHPMYHRPDGEVLQEILRIAKHLKSLHITKADLSSDVIAKILNIVSDRLETLGICHDWQKEPVPDRMEHILKGIARHCPNLKSLAFYESEYHYEERLPIFATEEQKQRCSRALDEVAEKAPGFKSYRHLRSMILHRFTELSSDLMIWNDILQGSCTEAEF